MIFKKSWYYTKSSLANHAGTSSNWSQAAQWTIALTVVRKTRSGRISQHRNYLRIFRFIIKKEAVRWQKVQGISARTAIILLIGTTFQMIQDARIAARSECMQGQAQTIIYSGIFRNFLLQIFSFLYLLLNRMP